MSNAQPPTGTSAYDALIERQRAATASDPRLCACLCGEKISGRRVRTRFKDERHKQKAYRDRIAARAADQGLTARSGVLSLGTLSTGAGPQTRNGDAAKPRARRQAVKREGVSVYFPTVAIAKASRTALAGIPEARRAIDRALERRREREATS